MATGRPIVHAGMTDEYRQIDVRHLHRKGLLTPDRHFNLCWASGLVPSSLRGSVDVDSVTLSYDMQGEGRSAPQQHTYQVRLVRTPCSFGGCRSWFLCPRAGCSRKVAILYADVTLACRRCQNLTYTSRRLDADQRSLLHAQALRRKLGASSKFWEALPPRPRGMRTWTYTQLSIKILAAERQALGFALALAKSGHTSGR